MNARCALRAPARSHEGNGRFPPWAPLPLVLTANRNDPRPPCRWRRRKQQSKAGDDR